VNETQQSFIIKSEADAYELLKLKADGVLDLSHAHIKFEGWPKLQIHLVGDKYHQTITPTLMKTFLDIQTAIYRSYSLATYNSPNIRLLKKEERDELEIEVKVSDGSSEYEIDLQEIFLKIIEKVGDKMEPDHIVIMVVSIAVLFFGKSAINSYLENRKEIKGQELKSEEQLAQIEALRFASQQETERAKIMAGIIKQEPRIENIEKTAYDMQTSIIKALSSADQAELQGLSIDPEIARMLTANARRKSEEVRLDGRFKILRVDSSDPTEFKVRIFNVASAELLDAVVQDSTLNQRNKPILQEAEWSRKPVDLTINAKDLRGQIHNAVIIDVKKIAEETA
jgi:hypothetical protein